MRRKVVALSRIGLSLSLLVAFVAFTPRSAFAYIPYSKHYNQNYYSTTNTADISKPTTLRILSGPAAQYHMFVVDAAGYLLTATRGSDSSNWGAWQSHGKPAGKTLSMTRPACRTQNGQDIVCVARATDSTLWTKSYSPSTGWSSWGQIPTMLNGVTRSPAYRASFAMCRRRGYDYLDLYFVATDGNVYGVVRSSQWGSLSDLGKPSGGFYSDADADSVLTCATILRTDSAGQYTQLFLFGVGADRNVWEKYIKINRTGWSGWGSGHGRPESTFQTAHITAGTSSAHPDQIHLFIAEDFTKWNGKIADKMLMTFSGSYSWSEWWGVDNGDDAITGSARIAPYHRDAYYFSPAVVETSSTYGGYASFIMTRRMDLILDPTSWRGRATAQAWISSWPTTY